MKNNMNTNSLKNTIGSFQFGSFQTTALLGCVLFGLSALNAQAQTPVRNRSIPYRTASSSGQTNTSARYPAYYNGQVTVTTPSGTYRSVYNNGQANATAPYIPYRKYMTPPNGNPMQNANSLQNPNTNTGPANMQSSQQSQGSPPQQQTQGGLTAQFTAANELLVQWSGNPGGVRQVTLGLFDANGQMLDSRVLTQAPFMAHFAPTSTGTGTHYGAQILYANGKTTAIYQSL